ncbi:hypothetical protein [Subtercola vilae]|uniref:hypothetical protein n=1 Tax=Subtercola vilae TaxID=2056433 RepID=UPI001375C9AD|nr:hypothetical protein [Subtercola vilae]
MPAATSARITLRIGDSGSRASGSRGTFVRRASPRVIPHDRVFLDDRAAATAEP